MRYPAAEKLEIIRLVEQSHLPTRQTLEMFGVSAFGTDLGLRIMEGLGLVAVT